VIKKQKRIKIFLAISIFLFFSAFSVYPFYNSYVETDFPSSKPKIENFDQDYLLDNHQNNLEILRPNAFPLVMETALSGRLFLFFQISSLCQKIIILRC
jgi:hypothetical protein